MVTKYAHHPLAVILPIPVIILHHQHIARCDMPQGDSQLDGQRMLRIVLLPFPPDGLKLYAQWNRMYALRLLPIIHHDPFIGEDCLSE